VPPPVGLPITVDVGIRILGITAIDELHGIYTAEIDGYASWQDPRMAFDPAPGEAPERVYLGRAAESLLAGTWSPDFNALNAVGATTRKRLKLVVRPDGTVNLRTRVQGDLYSPFDFRDFPFDRQRLILAAESYSWDAQIVQLERDQQRTGFNGRFEIPEWDVIEVSSSVIEALQEGDPETRSRLLLEIEIGRKLGFYLWKIILPLMTLVCVSWIVFWMSGERLARRAGVSMTGLLTVVAYQFVISESLPRVAYLTIMDKLMLLSFITIAATLVVNFIVEMNAIRESDWGDRIDRSCRWLFPVTYIAALALMARSVSW
jgi:hypothetical protein